MFVGLEWRDLHTFGPTILLPVLVCWLGVVVAGPALQLLLLPSFPEHCIRLSLFLGVPLFRQAISDEFAGLVPRWLGVGLTARRIVADVLLIELAYWFLSKVFLLLLKRNPVFLKSRPFPLLSIGFG